MPPKRSAPQPPVESSEETASGSGSDESEEEEITQSPPSAAPKNPAPPPQKVQQPEASDEEEEDEEEEEEEEDEGKVNQAAPPSTTKNPPPPQPNREESESDEGEEEEETDEEEEAPQQKPAAKQEAEGKGGKPPSSSEDKKPAGAFQRIWSKDDDVRILEALAAHRREHGKLPQPDELEAALAGSLDHSEYSRRELMGKLKSLKTAYTKNVNKGDPPSKDHDRRLYDLSKEVWGAATANGTAPRDFDEMCELYPNLAEELKELDKAHPGLFKREFGLISDEKARALDMKIKKQRLMQMKVELRRCDMTKEVTKTLIELAE